MCLESIVPKNLDSAAPLITRAEAARILGISPETLARSGVIAPVFRGKRFFYYRRSDVAALAGTKAGAR